MKIRSLHPSFFSDAKVCQLSAYGRLLFAGLWCYADDYGRGRLLPKSIEGAVFPRDEVDINALLREVITAGLVRVFTDGIDEFYEIPSWSEYQSPKYQSKTSIPDPETLENPYTAGPGQIVPILVETSPELSPGEGEGVERSREGVIAPKAQTDLDSLKAVLVEVFGEPTPGNWSLYNRIATWIRDRGGSPDDVRDRAARLAAEWGVKATTPAALEKHWTRYDAAVGQVSDSDVAAYQKQVRRLHRRKEILDGT